MAFSKKILVVYYSRSGATKKVAENIAAGLKCDIEEIQDTKNRKGIIGLIRSGYEAVTKKTTIIKKTKKNPSNYDIVIVGTPIWASTISSAVRTYILENKSKFKAIAFFCTFSGSGELGASKALKELYKKEPLLSIGIKRNDADNIAYVNKFKALIK